MSSDRAKHWAWSQLDLSGSELLLLLAMADNVGENLVCYAALATLAEMARMSERTVQRTLDRLEEAGKISRHERPGRTTVFTLLIPTDFGRKTSARRRVPTHDNLSGVGGDRPSEATHDKVSGVTPANMSGVAPTTDCRGPPSDCRGTHDILSPDSSLNSSLPKPPTARPRAGPGQSPARAAAPQVGGEEFLLDNQAVQLNISKRQANETLADYRGRVAAAHDRKLHAAAAEFAAQKRAEFEQQQSSSPEQPPNEAAA